jgi:hypothetical protein
MTSHKTEGEDEMGQGFKKEIEDTKKRGQRSEI